jgi:hypothetical protein
MAKYHFAPPKTAKIALPTRTDNRTQSIDKQQKQQSQSTNTTS